jgi:hypothetical protein
MVDFNMRFPVPLGQILHEAMRGLELSADVWYNDHLHALWRAFAGAAHTAA